MARWPRLIVLASLLGPAVSAAQDAPEDTVKTRSLVTDFGLVNAAGNTSTLTFNLSDKFIARTVDKKLIFTQTFVGVYGTSDGEKSVENYRAQLRLDRRVTGKLYGYLIGGWDRNPFGGIDRRFEETIGLAYRA